MDKLGVMILIESYSLKSTRDIPSELLNDPDVIKCYAKHCGKGIYDLLNNEPTALKNDTAFLIDLLGHMTVVDERFDEIFVRALQAKVDDALQVFPKFTVEEMQAFVNKDLDNMFEAKQKRIEELREAETTTKSIKVHEYITAQMEQRNSIMQYRLQKSENERKLR